MSQLASNRSMDRRTLFSIVIPVFNEEETLPLLFERVSDVVAALPVTTEVILVNDGSSDSSLPIMLRHSQIDPTYRVVDLSRNFGHQLCVSAGLAEAKGNVVGIIDADLQDPPELFSEMLKRWSLGADIVYGERRHRDGESRFKLITASLFYRLLARLSDVEIPLNTGDFRIVDKSVLAVVNAMPERQRFLRGMFAWVGFKQEAFPYDRAAREAGTTKYPFRKMLELSLDGVFSSSVQPLRWLLYFGLLLTAASFVGGIYLLVLRFADPDSFSPGIAGLFFSLLLLFGFNFVFLGLIGEYLGRSYLNTIGRPAYLVRAVFVGGKQVDRDAAS